MTAGARIDASEPPSSTGALTYADYQGTRIFRNLDGVRAIAVLWVVLFHVDPFGTGLLGPVARAGPAGVDVFFVLSGFLITTLLLREPPRPLGQTLRGFYLRRALRIFPLFYAAVPLYALAAWTSGVPGDREQFGHYLPSLLLYCADWFMATMPSPSPRFAHAWSLAIEEKFYVLWPAIVLCGAGFARRVGIATIAAVVAWRIVLVTTRSGPEQEAHLYLPIQARLDALMWGALLALLLHERTHYGRLAAFCAHRAVFWSMLAAFVGSVVLLPHRFMALQHTFSAPMLAVVLAGIVTRPAMPGLALLRHSVLAWMGRVSYGVYVLHPAVIAMAHAVLARLAPRTPEWITLPIFVGASVGAAGVSFRWFEAPLLRLKERWR